MKIYFACLANSWTRSMDHLTKLSGVKFTKARKAALLGEFFCQSVCHGF